MVRWPDWLNATAPRERILGLSSTTINILFEDQQQVSVEILYANAFEPFNLPIGRSSEQYPGVERGKSFSSSGPSLNFHALYS